MLERLRKLMAPFVVALMLLQVASPMITAAAQEVPAATPVVEDETPESDEPSISPMAVELSGAITSLAVSTSSGGTDLNYWDSITVSGTFTLPAGAKTGDFFTLQAPAELNVPSGLSKTLDGNQVQMSTGAGGLITFTLLVDIDVAVTNGVFYLESTAQQNQISWDDEVTFTFSGSVTGEVTTSFTFQTGPEPGPQPVPTNPYKWSWNNPANGTLTFHIGTGSAASDGSFTIVDSAAGWDYDCDTSMLYYGSSYTNENLNVDGSRALTDAECGEDFINVSGTLTAGGGAYVLANTKPVAGGYTFTNTATVTITGKEPQQVSTSVNSYDFGGGSSGPVSPVSVTWAPQTCDGGTWIAPVITPANGTITDGVLYTNGSATVNGNVVELRLTAQRGAAQTWENLGQGWSTTDDPRVINFYAEIDYVPCEMEEVDLQLPTVEAYVCEGGVDPNPTVNVPADTADIDYTLTSDIDDNGDFIVTASKLNGDKAWPTTLPSNSFGAWEMLEGVMTFEGHVDIVPCVPADEVDLQLPTVEAYVCEGGVDPNPTVNVPADTDDIDYTLTQDIDDNGDFVVTATLKTDGKVWPTTLPSNSFGSWGGVEGVMTFTGHVNIVPCVPADEVDLQLPTVEAYVCEGGVDPNPTVNVPADTDDIDYTLTQDIDDNGDFIVTATKLNDDKVWPDTLPSNSFGMWVELEGVMTFEGHVDIVPCVPAEEVDLALPTVEAYVCEGGVEPNPTVNVPADTDDIDYTLTADIDENGDFVVTATLKNDDKVWPATLPSNSFGAWADVQGVMTFTGHVDIVPCDQADLVVPTVDAAVCVGGVQQDPQSKTVNVPANTDLVSYELTKAIAEDGTYEVTATKDANTVWGNLNGFVPVDGTDTAVYSGQVEIVPCTPVVPVAPTISGNVCTGGAYVPPTVVYASEPAGVTYSDGTAVAGQITATATLSDGQSWGPLSDGWTVDAENPAVAHYVGSYTEAPCAPVIPADPVVNQAVCTGGELVPPTVTTVDTDRITYTVDGDQVPGGSVTITATLADGYAWDENMPAGWVIDEENPAVATLTITLDDVDCTPAVPVDPSVTQAVCTGGELVDPSVVPATTEGITYTIDGTVTSGGTVTVTAKLADGYEWDMMPEGWTKVDNTTATRTITLEDIKCTPVVPVNPNVKEAVCEGEKVVDPSVELPTTPGVTYTTSGEAKAGGKMTITATIGDGYEWGELPAGWTKVNPTTATYEITFAGISCEKPVTPPVVNELPKTGAGESTSNSMLLIAGMSMFGLAALGVTLRTRNQKN